MYFEDKTKRRTITPVSWLSKLLYLDNLAHKTTEQVLTLACFTGQQALFFKGQVKRIAEAIKPDVEDQVKKM